MAVNLGLLVMLNLFFMTQTTAQTGLGGMDRLDWSNYEVSINVDKEGMLLVHEVHTVNIRGQVHSMDISLGLTHDQKLEVVELYQYNVLPKESKIYYKANESGDLHTYRQSEQKLEWFFRERSHAPSKGEAYTFHITYKINKSLKIDGQGLYRIHRQIGPNSKTGRIRNFLVTAKIDDNAWYAVDPLPKGTEFFDVAGSHLYTLNLKLRKKDIEKIRPKTKKDFIIACKLKTNAIEKSFMLMNSGTPRELLEWPGELNITFDGSEVEGLLQFKSVKIAPLPTFTSMNQEIKTLNEEMIAFYRGNFELMKEKHLNTIATWFGQAIFGAALWPELKIKPGQTTRQTPLEYYSLSIHETGVTVEVGSDKFLVANIEGIAMEGFTIPQKFELTLNTSLVQGVKESVEFENCINYL